MITRPVSALGSLFNFRVRCVSSLLCAILVCFAARVSLAQTNVFDAPRPPAVAQPTPAQGAPVDTGAAPSANAGALSAPSGYQLSPNDQVAVEVFGEDDLRTNGRLNAEGNLSLPLLGSVRLSGLTLTQATARVTELYARDYLVNPKVNVMLVGYAKRR